MMNKRIIPCLDIKDGRVVKGINFINFQDAGDPVELASFYDREGADEVVFLDIAASCEGRKAIAEVVKKAAQQVYIPKTVGGGISNIDDINNLLKAGAEKVSINTAAVKNPSLISEAAKRFGSKFIVLACDVKKKGQSWEVFIQGGMTPTGLDVFEWLKKAVKLGAGEILLTSIDADGTKGGYDIELIKAVTELIDIPVIASGGAGNLQHFKDVFEAGADAALAALVFHNGKYRIREVKQYLHGEGIDVRL